MIQLKNGSFPSSILSLFVTKELALFAMVLIFRTKIGKVRVFCIKSLNVFNENPSKAIHKSSKLFFLHLLWLYQLNWMTLS